MAKAAPKKTKSSPKAEARARPKPKVKEEAGPVTRRSPKPASKPKGRVAQRTERDTSKVKVAGSTPAPVAKAKKPAKRKEPKSLGLTQAIIDAAPKRGRGRPPTGFDKLAYQRDYMRKKRAAARAAKGAK